VHYGTNRTGGSLAYHCAGDVRNKGKAFYLPRLILGELAVRRCISRSFRMSKVHDPRGIRQVNLTNNGHELTRIFCRLSPSAAYVCRMNQTTSVTWRKS